MCAGYDHRNLGGRRRVAAALTTYHAIDDKSLNALQELYTIAYNHFEDDGDKARKMLGGKDKNDAKTAALVVVTNALLNLDEVVTRN